MRTRKTPPDTQKEREMERKGEGPTRILCWMRAIELKIVGEREREREMERKGEGRTRFLCQMRAT